LAWDLGVCSSQGLRFDSLGCQFQRASLASSKKKNVQALLSEEDCIEFVLSNFL